MIYFFFIAAAIVSVMAIREGYFSATCLANACRDRRNGITHFNYLRYEMPHNDIEHQIEDEIGINILYLSGLVMWFVSLFTLTRPFLPMYIAYLAAAVVFYILRRTRLSERYSEYYDLFSTKKNREDFSDLLVIYGLRIEGTLGKLKKSLIFGFLGIAYCLAIEYLY